jgi:hypothetical protein
MAETKNLDFNNLKERGDAGDVYAQLILGNHFIKENDYKQAVEWLKKAAEQDDADAQRKLGSYYYDGKGVKKDRKTARKWHKKAAEQGDLMAQRLLGQLNYNDEDSKKDIKLSPEKDTSIKVPMNEETIMQENIIKPLKKGSPAFILESPTEIQDTNRSKGESKTIRLVCYDIFPTNPKLTKKINLVKELSEALSKGKINDRCRIYSDIAVEGEIEFITKRIENKKGLFCTFLRLKEGGAVLVSNALLSEKEISLEELAAAEEKNTKGHLKDYTYFLFTDKLLIMRATRGVPSSDISIYLNWLLKNNFEKYNNQNAVFTLKPRLKKDFDPMTVGSIELDNDIKIGEKRTVDTVVHSVIKGLEQLLKAYGYDGIPAGKVIDASVIIKIIKPSQKDKDKNSKALQAILDILKNDEIIIRNKKNQIITIDNVKESKSVRVPHLATGFPDIAELEQRMLEYYNEVV